jgi:hypothetical protein
MKRSFQKTLFGREGSTIPLLNWYTKHEVEENTVGTTSELKWSLLEERSVPST